MTESTEKDELRYLHGLLLYTVCNRVSQGVHHKGDGLPATVQQDDSTTVLLVVVETIR